jgi:hypothetical protein
MTEHVLSPHPDLGPWRILAGAAVLLALVLAAHPWLCDDIFITFRYVDQARAGHGLVYNPGERVEGYTHFLWAVLLWALSSLGIGLDTLGRWLPLPFHLGTVAVLALTSRALYGRREVLASAARGAAGWTLPVAAFAWAVHREAQVFASGGLETSAYTFCLVLGFYLVAARDSRRARAGGAVAYALAALLRPEGLAHAALAGGWVALRRREDAARFAGLVVGLVAPLFVWRRFYYGDLVPNAYYAKSAAHAYWSQGFIYLGLYLRYYAALGVAGLAGLALLLRRHGPGGRATRDPIRPALFLALAHVALIFLTTAYVGGDFMFARFLLPATPFLALLCEHAVQALPGLQLRALAAAALVAAVFGGGLWRDRTLHGQNVAMHGIADERSQYPPDLLETRHRQGEVLARCFTGTKATFLVQGSQASYAYWGKLPIAIEAYGLTDRTVARLPLMGRGRPGHERQPPLAYLLRRRTQFLIHLPGSHPMHDFASVRFGDLLGEMIFYDRALLEQVRSCPDFHFVDFPAYLDAYIARARSLEPDIVRRDASIFRGYYFTFNSDPARQARIDSLVRSLPEPGSTGGTPR